MRCFLLLCLLIAATVSSAAERPNLVFIIADDLGFGDLGCYGGTAIPTPRIDRMASEGIRMTRAYAPAATCTPTRFSIMTGRYPWRPQKRSTAILNGDAPLAIEPGTPTLPQVLRNAGYHTELVGKWHLGIGDGETPVDFNGRVGPGPLEVGFEKAFYIPATVDRVPCVFIEDHAVAGLDPADPIRVSYRERVGGVAVGDPKAPPLKYPGDAQHSNAIVNGISRIGYMAGGESARWVDEDITDTLAQRAVKMIERESKTAEPYFLMLGLHDPHKPHAPHPRFVGKSACGRRGDSIVQIDWVVGQVLDALQRTGDAENTLVMVTSDNGGVIYDGYEDGAIETRGDHRCNGPLRGYKYHVYEGGCRVPAIVHWPGRVEPGESDSLFLLTDLLASLTSLAGVESLPVGGGPDSQDLLGVLLDADAESPRGSAILQGMGKRFALVTAEWKLVPRNAEGKPPGKPRRDNPRNRFTDLKVYADALYNLNEDAAEAENAIREHPYIAARLRAELAAVRSVRSPLPAANSE